MAAPSRIRATIFDKLVANMELSGLRADAADQNDEISRDSLRFYTVPSIERFNEAALKATVRRELAWLFNTVNLDAVQNLDAYPEVKRSVLNYGVADLTGKTTTKQAIAARAKEIHTAVTHFEPRIDAKSLEVEPRKAAERDNAISFDVRGDIINAVNALPVRFVTDVEVDTGAATVRE